MKLIFGGAYQGKKEFIKEKYNLIDSDILQCSEDMDFSFDYKAYANINLFILGCLQRKEDPIKFFSSNLDKLKDKVITCEDICCGVVPLGKEFRLYRDNVGKIMQLLSRESDEVYRIFCGLGDKLK